MRIASFALLAAACASPPPPEAPKPAAAPETSDAMVADEDRDAYLDVRSKEPTEIRVDGQSIGKTPIDHYKVAPGRHDVTFVFAPDDTPTLSVRAEPGKTATVKLDPMPHAKE